MIAWGEAVFRSSYHGQATSLNASAEEKDPARIELLERHGFIRLDEETVSMERALGEDIRYARTAGRLYQPAPLGEAGDSCLVALHRAAFGTENMTEDYRRVMAQTPGYDPDLGPGRRCARRAAGRLCLARSAPKKTR